MIEPNPRAGLRVFAALFGARIAAGATGAAKQAARPQKQPGWVTELGEPGQPAELATVMNGELGEVLRARIANPRLRTTRRGRGACRKRK